MQDSIWMTLTVIILIAVLLGSYYVRQNLKGSPWIDKALFDRGMDLPTMWIYYDDSQVNSRHWLDFGARSSRVLNQPYLNLCYESIEKAILLANKAASIAVQNQGTYVLTEDDVNGFLQD